MMFLVKKLISAWVISPAILGLLALAGLWISMRWNRRGGAVVSAASAAMIILLSLPVVSHVLLRAVECPAAPIADFRSAEAIVILGGGIHHGAEEFGQSDTLSTATLVRIRYGAWLAKRTHLPVLVTGGSVFGGPAEAALMASALEEEFGVPVRWIEAESKDTGDNAVRSAAMLKVAGIHRIALVTHAGHMPRALALFKRQGLVVEAAPTFGTAVRAGDFDAWLPSGAALQESFGALHEAIGMWVSP